jgi:hypothetical protein
MSLPQNAPGWATDLNIALESGASGQFILYGNVHDRLAVNGRLGLPSPTSTGRAPGE